jgi:hypothetical protein
MRPKLRRLAQLEKLVAPYLERVKIEEEQQRTRESGLAFYHAIKLGALVLHGDPKLDEPLEAAWERCLAKFEAERAGPLGKPLLSDALYLADPVLEELQGDTRPEKLQHLFDIAPPWLIKFTGADFTAHVLGIKCRDLSDAPPWGYIARRTASGRSFQTGRCRLGPSCPR